MRKIIVGTVAAVTLAAAAVTPAAAQWRGHHHHGHWGGPGISLSFGAPYSYYGGPYAYSGAYAAVPACEVVRVKHVRPNGRVVWRTIQRC